ncbi:MAG TPA: hypothetical protein VHX44_07225 [Planctomycetota bacterium]|jgi:hypothetical protein|nr:hypothetical protein [Planctomycetota bacterium]
MPFDLSPYRTAGLFWVVQTRAGREVSGLITTIGDGDFADIRLAHGKAPAVTIANHDILTIRPGLRAVPEDDEDS